MSKRFNIGDFNETGDKTIPVNFDKTVSIFNKEFQCGDNIQAEFDVSAEAKLDANVTIGINVAGSIVPPEISNAAVFSSMYPFYPG